MNITPACHVCHQGTLLPRKVYRCSLPVIIIGYILLIPSFIGMLVGLIGLVATAVSGTKKETAIENGIRAEMRAAGIPEVLIIQAFSGKPLPALADATLPAKQRTAFRNFEDRIAAINSGGQLVPPLIGTFSIFFFIYSFVGGLLGWLLIMKKRILQCTACTATVAAG